MISLTGVLRRACHTPWVPHDEGATEDEAIAAIVRHMRYDALRVDLLDDANGPIHADHGVYAWGNFTICSGAFRIEPLSVKGREALAAAWAEHRESRHFKLAVELAKMAAARQHELDNVRATHSDRYSHTYASVCRGIRERWSEKMRPLNTQLEAIYAVGRTSC